MDPLLPQPLCGPLTASTSVWTPYCLNLCVNPLLPQPLCEPLTASTSVWTPYCLSSEKPYHLLCFLLFCTAAPEVGDSPRSPRVSPILGCDQDELQVAEEPASMETGDPNTTDDDSDPFKSEGLISCQIPVSDLKEFVSTMSSQRLSHPVSIRDLPWCVTEAHIHTFTCVGLCFGIVVCWGSVIG